MINFTEILIQVVNTILDHASVYLTSLSDAAGLPAAGSGVTIALAAGAMASIPESLRAATRRWHGSIEDKFSNIQNLYTIVYAHSQAWSVPTAIINPLINDRNELQILINKCRSTAGSGIDRARRDVLLEKLIDHCLNRVKLWAYGKYAETPAVMTLEDIHELGFLLPGETGGRRDRSEATNITAEVKVTVVNEDFIRVVIDQSAGENAARVVHGWPEGVRNALIVITAADGTTEVYRQFTTRLYNDIRMPDGSHGKQFIVKASFLKHVNDEPRFGNEPTFSMPFTTADIIASSKSENQVGLETSASETEHPDAGPDAGK
jgi:hypothetical protein